MRISNLLANHTVNFAITSYNGREDSGQVSETSYATTSLTDDGPYTVEITSSKSGSSQTLTDVGDDDEVACWNKSGSLGAKTLS